MANPFTALFHKVVDWVKSGRAKRDAELALHYAQEALPYIATASQFVVGLTPTQIDDAALAVVKVKYPRLFDGSIHTPDELKLYSLGVAGDLLLAKYPKLDTTIARSAIQLAYLKARGDGELPPPPEAPAPGGVILNVTPPTKSPLAL